VFSLCIFCICKLSSVLYFPAWANVNGTVKPNCADVSLRIYSLTHSLTRDWLVMLSSMLSLVLLMPVIWYRLSPHCWLDLSQSTSGRSDSISSSTVNLSCMSHLVDFITTKCLTCCLYWMWDTIHCLQTSHLSHLQLPVEQLRMRITKLVCRQC